MKEILKNWHIEVETINHIQNDVWDINDRYILKGSTDDRFQYMPKIYRTLNAHCIPAPKVVETETGPFYHEGDKLYLLTEKLKGEHLSVDAVLNSSKYQKTVGTVIGRLHLACDALEIPVWDNHFLEEMNGWVYETLKEHQETVAFQRFDDVMGKLKALDPMLERQIVHRDMHLYNMLFEAGEISGFLDFDLTQRNYRIFDMAYMMVGWIVDKTENKFFMETWRKGFDHIIQSYETVSVLSHEEHEAFGPLMCAIEMLFVAYFMKNNQFNFANNADRCLAWLVDHML